MNDALPTFLTGLLFGAGLAVSDMIDPARVLAFLDVAGAWDPTLAFVMAGALAVTAIGYRLVFRRPRPALAVRFALPTRTDLDMRLIGGATLFGIGWGLAGYCPGPAIAGLSLARWETAVFVAAMLAGMAVTRMIVIRPTRKAA